LREAGSGIEEVGPESFSFVKLLGGGSFGKVYLVKHKKTQGEYAMKILEKSKVTRGSLMRYTVTERNVLSYIRHPYIVALHYAFQTSKQLVLVLQYCPGGDLQKLLREEKRVDERRSCLYTAEVLTALAHLHVRFIVYRDLQPENIVLDREGHCMLTDFGLSKEGVAEVTKSFCGSLAFLAPEVLANKGHGHTVDIYGLGVLLFALLIGQPPFYDRNREKLINNIQVASLLFPPHVSQPAASLIRATMDREPKNRLGARKTTDIQSHAFYSSLDFDALMRREIPVPAPKGISFPSRQPAGATPDVPAPFASIGGGGWRGWRALLGLPSPSANPPAANARAVGGWDFSRVPEQYRSDQ
jgi:protein-serine/threonine kinase